MPKVSVLIATYNRADLIGRTIQSVREQDFRDWEIIVADDGSTDNTAEAMREFAARDSRIKYFPHEHFGYVAGISNFGLRQANGEYVAILDDDDYWAMKDKLSLQVDFLDKYPDYVACGGGFVTVDANGHETGRFLKPENDRDIKKRALVANPMVNSTTLFRREAAGKVGNYDETLPQYADWDFWLKLGTAGKFYNFQKYFVNYRIWEKSWSIVKQQECARTAWRIVWRHRKQYRGLVPALLVAAAQVFYAYLPGFVKKYLNPVLSRLKKKVFSS